MDDLIKVNNDIVSQVSGDGEVLYGKVLNIRSSTPTLTFEEL